MSEEWDDSFREDVSVPGDGKGFAFSVSRSGVVMVVDSSSGF